MEETIRNSGARSRQLLVRPMLPHAMPQVRIPGSSWFAFGHSPNGPNRASTYFDCIPLKRGETMLSVVASKQYFTPSQCSAVPFCAAGRVFFSFLAKAWIIFVSKPAAEPSDALQLPGTDLLSSFSLRPWILSGFALVYSRFVAFGLLSLGAWVKTWDTFCICIMYFRSSDIRHSMQPTDNLRRFSHDLHVARSCFVPWER